MNKSSEYNHCELKIINDSDAEFIKDNFSEIFLNSSIDKIKETIKKWREGVVYFIKNEKDIIGLIILGRRSESILNFGIMIKENYRKKGYATKAFELAKKIAKNEGFNTILSSCSVNNIASLKMHEKIGFKLVKREINQAGNEMCRWELKIK